MSWYCLKVHPNREFQADRSLKALDFWHYLPVIPKDPRIKKRGRDHQPLFPGYSFIYLEAGADDFSRVKSCLYVSDFVRFGDSPSKMTEGDIELIRQIERELRPPGEYKEGDLVRVHLVVDGADQFREAIYRCKTGKERSDVMIIEMHRRLMLNVADKEIEPV